MEMMQEMSFTADPSTMITFLKAFRTRKSRYHGKEVVPSINAERNGFRINKKHLETFNEICGLGDRSSINGIYFFTLAYPYIMRILTSREMPFSMFRVLNTRNSIIIHREVRVDEVVNIRCFNSDIRVLEKGLEVDLSSRIFVGSELVWENVTTYFVKGRFHGIDAGFKPPVLDVIPEAPKIGEWYLPARNRFKFGLVSGDTNGIHYWKMWARISGFERDFAQPIRVVAKCLDMLPLLETDGAVKLDFFLKGPVYYNHMLYVKNVYSLRSNRFDLYCRGNERPCICGKMYEI
ncbi:MAG: hypothetical protein GY754_36550 [bacterium]|nr:hypothetical protein [bacterium]